MLSSSTAILFRILPNKIATHAQTVSQNSADRGRCFPPNINLSPAFLHPCQTLLGLFFRVWRIYLSADFAFVFLAIGCCFRTPHKKNLRDYLFTPRLFFTAWTLHISSSRDMHREQHALIRGNIFMMTFCTLVITRNLFQL